MIGQNNNETQIESRANKADRGIFPKNTNGPIQMISLQVDMHTLEENSVSKIRSEVDSVMTAVETRIQDAVLTAIENLIFPRVELAKKLTNVSLGRSVDSNVLELDKTNFLGNIEGLQMTASSRTNSHTDLDRTDDTRGNITVEGGDSLVNDRNTD